MSILLQSVYIKLTSNSIASPPRKPLQYAFDRFGVSIAGGDELLGSDPAKPYESAYIPRAYMAPFPGIHSLITTNSALENYAARLLLP